MPKTLDSKKKEIQGIIDNNGFIDVYERKINNNGTVFVSASKKKDVRGCPVLVIVLSKDMGGEA